MAQVGNCWVVWASEKNTNLTSLSFLVVNCQHQFFWQLLGKPVSLKIQSLVSLPAASGLGNQTMYVARQVGKWAARLCSSCRPKPAGHTGGSRCPTLGGNHSCKKFWIIVKCRKSSKYLLSSLNQGSNGDFNCHCDDFALFRLFLSKTEHLVYV